MRMTPFRWGALVIHLVCWPFVAFNAGRIYEIRHHLGTIQNMTESVERAERAVKQARSAVDAALARCSPTTPAPRSM